MQKFVECLHTISKTKSRNTKTDILTKYLRNTSMPNRVIACDILLNNYTTNIKAKTLNKTHAQTTLFTDPMSLSQLWKYLQLLESSRADNQKCIVEMFARCTPLEFTYLSKILTNNINIGIDEKGVLAALSKLLGADITRSYYISNNIAVILNGQLVTPQPLTFIRPQLGRIDPKIIDDAINNPSAYVIDIKYDGIRYQFHKSGTQWKIYTRRGEDYSHRLHNVGNTLMQKLNTINNCILDGELISQSMKVQDAMKIGEELTPVVFDVLYWEDINCLDEPQRNRSAQCRYISKTYDIQTSQQFTSVNEAFDYAMTNGYEGIMIKPKSQIYLPNERKWTKLKKSTDTMDLAIIGAEYGEGKREGLFGSFILAGMLNGTLSPICKVGTGFSDADLKYLHSLLVDDIEISNQYSCTFTPRHIMEVKYFELTNSSLYPCGKSLRFPVYVKLRRDKSLNDIDNIDNL